MVPGNGSILTEFLAQGDDSVERFDGEVDPAVQVPQVGQLDPKGLMHRREVEEGIRLDTVLVQGGARSGKPSVSSGPPQGVV